MNLSDLADPSVKKFADDLVKAREEYEEQCRKDLLEKIDAFCTRWRHNHAGWDVNDSGRDDMEYALDLLSEIYEELRDI